MKTYEVTQVVEMTVTHTVRARNADEANATATSRTEKLCSALARVRTNINFGDITEDYLPATDDGFGTQSPRSDSEIYGEPAT